MSLQTRRQKVKQEAVAKAIGLHRSTVKNYFAGKLKGTATEKKIASYLNKVHNEEIKGIIK